MDKLLVAGDDGESALERQFKETPTGTAFGALSEGLVLDSPDKRDDVLALAMELSDLEENAGTFRPLASACVAAGGLSKATVETIRDNREAVTALAEKWKPAEGVDYAANDLSFQVARCGEREQLKDSLDRSTFDRYAERFIKLLEPIGELPPDAKGLFENAVSISTGRSIDELRGDNDLLAIHHTPLAGELHQAVNSRIRTVREAIQSDPDNLERQKEAGTLRRMKFELDELRGDYNENVGQDTGFWLRLLLEV